MATHLKIAFVTCLLLFILMEEFNPVLAKQGERLKQRTKILETTVVELKEKIQELEECNACSKIKELNDTIKELQEKVDNKTTSAAAAGLEDSEILKEDASYQRVLGDFLKPVVQSNSQWKRCWRASLDGWSSTTFHSLCDNMGPTITIVRVGQYIFGGYTSASWASDRCQWVYDQPAFLFSLVNKPGWQPLKLYQTGIDSYVKSYSVYSCDSYGPTFGGGYDFKIASDASSNTKSYSNLGGTYGPPTGYGYDSPEAHSFLAGSRFFQASEVEVFYETT